MRTALKRFTTAGILTLVTATGLTMATAPVTEAAGSVDKAVSWAIAIANDDTHGYDQAKRNGPDYDCSSLVSTAFNKAGFNVSGSLNTDGMKDGFKKAGFTIYTFTTNSSAKSGQLRKADLKKGDILLYPGGHTALVTDTSSKQIVHATVNEKGTKKGGETGDQTGREIYVTSFNNSSYASIWKYVIRWEGATPTTSPTKAVTYFPKYTGSSVSIVDGLKAVGAPDTSLAYRKTIATANGITGYTGTASQNTKMLNLLKQGKLSKP